MPGGAEDASNQSLQPTCCQRAPYGPISSQVGGLSPCQPPASGPAPATRTDVRAFGTDPPRGTLDSPEASPVLSGGAVGAALASCDHHHAFAPRGLAPCGGACVPRRALSAPRGPGGLATDAPCRAARCRRRFACGAERSREPFPQTAHQRRRFPDSKRLPPKSPGALPSAFAGARPPDRHWCLGLAASAQLPTRIRSAAFHRVTRPAGLPGYSPELHGPRAALRLLQLYGTESTTKNWPDPGACHTEGDMPFRASRATPSPRG